MCATVYNPRRQSQKHGETVKKQTRMILAIDETDGQKALKIVEQVAEYIDAVKINWPLVLSEGPEMITKLSKFTDVICDFKVADIPNTVSLIVSNAVKRGAAAVIVHAFTGDDSLKAAVEAAGSADIYAVTEMSHPGGKMFTAKHAEEMAKLGVECGAKGFIAPATRRERIAAIRAIIGDRLILSPGVGAQGGSLEEVCKHGLNKDCGLLVNSSRGIIYASNGSDFAEAAGREAQKLQQQMAAVL